tara:strand:- start:1034 stop:1558 length:525 start_codon:yes stop_codon:yes gene_type:complete
MADSYSLSSLTLDFNSEELIETFDFDFGSSIADSFFEAFISSVELEYDGIWPVRENDEGMVFSLSIGEDIARPSFTEAFFGTDKYNVQYSSGELLSLQDKFSREDIETQLDNVANQMASNVINTTNQSREFDFNKTKVKKIGFKNISKFEAQQESTTTADTAEVTAGTFSIGSY